MIELLNITRDNSSLTQIGDGGGKVSVTANKYTDEADLNKISIYEGNFSKALVWTTEVTTDNTIIKLGELTATRSGNAALDDIMSAPQMTPMGDYGTSGGDPSNFPNTDLTSSGGFPKKDNG